MNEFYKLLVYFGTGEMITRDFLLRKPGITEELIDLAMEHGYITITSPTSEGYIRYTITNKGKEKRDN